MVTIYCFSSSEWNNPLIMEHWFSNSWIIIIKSTTLFNTRDLEHCEAWSFSPSVWKICYLPGRGSLWPGLRVMFLCWHCSESDPNRIWALGELTLCIFLGVLKDCASSPPKKSLALVTVAVWFLFWESQTTGNHHYPKKSGPFVQWHCNNFSESFKQLRMDNNRNIWNQNVFCLRVGYRFVLNDDNKFIV